MFKKISMDISYFTLTDGVLELHNDKLVIADNAKRNRFSMLAVTISGLIYGLSCLFRGLKDNANEWLYLGIFLSLFWTVSLIFGIKIYGRIDKEIYLNDISEVSFKGWKEDTTIATIKTLSKRFRRVNIENVDNLPDLFRDKIQKLNIKVT